MPTDWNKVDAIAQATFRNPEGYRQPELTKEPFIIEYISEYDSCQYTCVCGFRNLDHGMNFCPGCGHKLIWQKKIIDPRSKLFCLFCGKNNIERPVMVTNCTAAICSDCVIKACDKMHITTFLVEKNINLYDDDED